MIAKSSILALVLAASWFFTETASAGVLYSVKELTPHGPRNFRGYLLNNRGDFAGQVDAYKGHRGYAAVLSNGRLHRRGNAGHHHGQFYSFNDLGIAAGTVGSQAAIFAGVQSQTLVSMLNPQTTWRLLNNATGINNAGQVVGMGFLANGPLDSNQLPVVRAYLYQNGAATDLGDLGFGGTVAISAINNQGDAVGSACPDASQTVRHAVLFAHGAVLDLKAPGVSSEAYAINDRGQITGTYNPSSRHRPIRAFIYENGTMTDLGKVARYDAIFPAAINQSGEIVGELEGRHNRQGGFIYRGGQLHNLNDVIAGRDHWTIEDAFDINDSGVILVSAYDRLLKRSVTARLTPISQ